MTSKLYTVQVERYGEWVDYKFMPLDDGSVWTKPTFGVAKTLPAEEARRLWRALRRKGWEVMPESCINF